MIPQAFSRLFPLLVVASALAVAPACRGAGDGHVVTERRATAAFSKVETTASVAVDVAFASDASVDVRIDDNLRHLLRTDVRDDTLFVTTSDVLFPAPDAVVTVRLPAADEIAATNGGSGALQFSGPAHHLTLIASGSGATAAVDGSADLLTATLSGSGPIDAEELTATDAVLENSGAATLSAHVTGTMAITLTGSGDVRVAGAATATKSDDTGSGSIVRE